MQKQAMDAIFKNRNSIVLAPTGSGKTLAYLLPIVKMILNNSDKVQALILVPSRELALQIESVQKAMQSSVKMLCCYGGHAIEAEKKAFKNGPSLVVGTPGRIADHIKDGRFDCSEVSSLVLDEFDKCLNLGFKEEMKYIVENLKKLKKRVCISATALETIPKFLKMEDACRIEYTDDLIKPDITIKTVESPSADKLETLFKLVKYLDNESTLIFCNHRESADRVVEFLRNQKVDVIIYHGGMEQEEREKALLKFRNGSYNLLVTTDLASRGLDIPEIKYIIHYHLPSTEETFIHRNGRTARMKASGTTYIILSENDKLPAYLSQKPESEIIPESLPLPQKTAWMTLELNVGKRDKISKGDIVGFLIQKGRLEKEDLGIVDLMERDSFAAVKRSKVNKLLGLVAGELLKRKKIVISTSEKSIG
jgi:ATP-independent RNA helicase DbpA